MYVLRLLSLLDVFEFFKEIFFFLILWDSREERELKKKKRQQAQLEEQHLQLFSKIFLDRGTGIVIFFYCFDFGPLYSKGT